MLAVAVAFWQSAEQRHLEMEAADEASVARLVRGVCVLLSRCAERTIVVFALVMCMLLRRWRGQAGAGLGELRTPAVRNLPVTFVVLFVVVLRWLLWLLFLGCVALWSHIV